jgi:hypothetical protein
MDDLEKKQKYIEAIVQRLLEEIKKTKIRENSYHSEFYQ